MASYEELKNADKKDGERYVFLPLREPGTKIWQQVVQEVEKGNKIKALKKTLETATQ